MKSKETYLFHGGCHGCTMQNKKGLGYCVECQFFDCDWSKPNLNNMHKKTRIRKRRNEKKGFKIA